jgi:quercetin dioxygenase-like cupin family protein
MAWVRRSLSKPIPPQPLETHPVLHHPAQSRPAVPTSPDDFTGEVTMHPVIQPPAPSRARAVIVDFTPGARTAWHSHPLGQTLYILSGTGWAQSWGGPVITMRAGDTLWFEPGEKHWHGATATTAMSHLAIHEAIDGRSVDWLEQVADIDYLQTDAQ